MQNKKLDRLFACHWYNCYTIKMERFKFDPNKSETLRNNPKRGIGFEEVQEIWLHPYYEDYRSDDPDQYRVIGWAQGHLYSVIFEVREDADGEYFHLVTLWKSSKEERKLYEKHIKA